MTTGVFVNSTVFSHQVVAKLSMVLLVLLLRFEPAKASLLEPAWTLGACQG